MEAPEIVEQETLNHAVVRSLLENVIALGTLWAYFQLQDSGSWLRLQLIESRERASFARDAINNAWHRWQLARMTGTETFDKERAS